MSRQADATTPLNPGQYDSYSSADDSHDESDDLFGSETPSETAYSNMRPSRRREFREAERLSVRLLAVRDDDSEEEERVLRQSLQLPVEPLKSSQSLSNFSSGRPFSLTSSHSGPPKPKVKVATMIWIGVAIVFGILGILYLLVTTKVVTGRPPLQPVGPYVLIEKQEGAEFFDYYSFYEGKDSVGSNGYNMYVNMDRAASLGIVNVTFEEDYLDVYNASTQGRDLASDDQASNTSTFNSNSTVKLEPFVYMGSSATAAGPRESIRLEGNRRFNRGLFIIDIRHMPAGCGVWPAFWLTDEANWPVNGEIDIVEGVNYQSEAKTALHATDGCSMFDIPFGTMTGTWDTAQGIPDAKTGIPDMTLRYARNCFVYDPHQWLNQGCVAVDKEGGTLGQPLNAKGGGVYALEWDPINRHIRTWVFTPHAKTPENLVDAIRTASNPDVEQRVMPDPQLWPLPYGYFAIGDGTKCPASHFRHMRLVFNLAFCGSVAGNRYHLDCKVQAKSFDTCNDWIKSEPEELLEAYWKIRGVYVYERAWERTWID